MLVPYAEKLNIDFIWVHGAATVLQSTLAHSLNSVGVPTLVVEMGVGMRITREYGDQLIDGILNLMHCLGIWKGDVKEVRKPIISTEPDEISFVNAPASGVFLPLVSHWDTVEKGQKIGQIVNPLDGTVFSEPLAEEDGIVFTIREYPVVSEGSLIARILRREKP